MSSTGQGYGDVNPLDVARKEMRPHEHLVWADRPLASTVRKTALGRIGFGIVFGGFALVWTGAAGVLSRGDTGFFGFFFPFFGLPFIAVGAGILLSGLRALAAAVRPVYALSDQRVLVIADPDRRNVRGFDLATIRGVERKEQGDGSGDLTLLLDGGRRTLRQSLAGIPEVARVGAEIDRLRRKAQETQPPPSVPPPAPPAEPDPSG